MLDIRIPSVPLITCDPYFSLWSPTDFLTDSDTVHWTGAIKPLRGRAVIDGVPYHFLGTSEVTQPMTQTSFHLSATAAAYGFIAGGIRLSVVFRTPLLPSDLDLMSRPCTFVDFSVSSDDGADHHVRIQIEADECFCWHGQQKPPVIGGTGRASHFTDAWLGKAVQIPLSHSGDDVTIDWGYLYLAVPTSPVYQVEYVCASSQHHASLKATATYQSIISGQAGFFVLAYDDILSIQYFSTAQPGYWARDGKTIREAISESVAQYDFDRIRCIEFDKTVDQKARASGGPEYALLCAVSYRQAVAAHKLIADEAGQPVFLSKECFSNGCIGTVDVSYPSAPLFLLFNPELIQGMLRPIFRFAQFPVWNRDYAPHDTGRYPYATGQVYGLRADPGANLMTHGARLPEEQIYPPFYSWPSTASIYDDHHQMPIEECGNMLILTAAVCMVSGDTTEAVDNIALLDRWATYLIQHGMDPAEQLSTDDFSGHLARNVNLAIKSAMGIAAFSLILRMTGKHKEAGSKLGIAKGMAATIMKDASLGDHLSQAFGEEWGWSIKYNLVWDEIFGFNLFSQEVIQQEVRWYLRHVNRYGLPLDYRHDYGKSDWILWASALTRTRGERIELMRPILFYLRETMDRVPFSDFYDTKTAEQQGMQNRSVQGGIFMPMYVDHHNAKVRKDE